MSLTAGVRIIESVTQGQVNSHQGLPIPYLWGLPLTIYVGFILFASVLTTATLGYLYHKRIIKIPIKVHRNLAYLSIGIAVFHGVLAAIDRFFGLP